MTLEKLGEAPKRFEIGTREGGNSRTTEFEVDGLSWKVDVSQESLKKSVSQKHNETNNIYYDHCNDHRIAMTTILSSSKQ